MSTNYNKGALLPLIRLQGAYVPSRSIDTEVDSFIESGDPFVIIDVAQDGLIRLARTIQKRYEGRVHVEVFY